MRKLGLNKEVIVLNLVIFLVGLVFSCMSDAETDLLMDGLFKSGRKLSFFDIEDLTDLLTGSAGWEDEKRDGVLDLRFLAEDGLGGFLGLVSGEELGLFIGLDTKRNAG